HVTDAVLNLLRIAAGVEAEHAQLALIRPQQTGGHAQQRRLAGAVGPDDRRQRAVRRCYADAIERPHHGALAAREGLEQVAADDDRLSASVHRRACALRSPSERSIRTVAGMPSLRRSCGSSTNTRPSW